MIKDTNLTDEGLQYFALTGNFICNYFAEIGEEVDKRKGNVDKKDVSKVQKRDASASSSSKNSKGKSYCKFCRKEGHRQKDCQDFKEWLTKKGIPYNPEAGKKPKNT
ncbi:unnamed protein product [Cuscuta campestris]|uniref:CCHC-type domain-containing protein n=1 Tax=Cuscuta campestris TaxID=132261 RepID=A0A484NMV3_9ASTE|nr:unnamed protein product [Cuscuta campestris]